MFKKATIPSGKAPNKLKEESTNRGYRKIKAFKYLGKK